MGRTSPRVAGRDGWSLVLLSRGTTTVQAQTLPSGSLPEGAKMSQLAGPESEWLVAFQAGATQTPRKSRKCQKTKFNQVNMKV